MLPCGKNGRFVRFLVAQGFFADFPACVACYAQAVQVGFDAVIEAGKVFEGVMGFVDSTVADKPLEGGFFGVLGEDVFYDHEVRYISSLLNLVPKSF